MYILAFLTWRRTIDRRFHRTHRTWENPNEHRAILKKASLKPLAPAGGTAPGTDWLCLHRQREPDANGEVSLVKSGVLSVCTNTPTSPSNTKRTAPSWAWTQTSPTPSPPTWCEGTADLHQLRGLDSGTGLSTGQCDIALAGNGATDERKSKMEFTTVYLDDNLAILVPQGLPSITSAADLKGVAVGAQQATSGETYAKENGAEVIQYEDTSLMFSALKTGQDQGSRREPSP